MIFRLALLFALTGAALAAGAEWRDEPALAGLTYDGRADANGVSAVADWTLDGGLYVSDQHHTLSFISSRGRIGVMLSTFVGRAEDGVATFTAGAAMSVPVIDNFAYVDTNCGEGAGFEGVTSQTEFIAGIAPKTGGAVEDGRFHGLIAAAKIDLTTGAITPVDPSGVYCIQEEVH
ncbi:MAG: hypothetical protein QM698_13155 [Micropepsaceae bacterium]